MTSVATDVRDLHRRATIEFDRRVELVRNDQWKLPTPCTEWTVRDLVNHVVGENLWARELFAGRTVAEVGPQLDGDLLGLDGQRAWRDSVPIARAVIDEEGALERIVHLSFGDFPGDEYVWQLVCDLTIHAWDLARALGADDRLDEELVRMCEQKLRPQEELLRASGAFGEQIEVIRGADPQTVLLALVGRRA
jgi:uncharacterized protein (TIGR03086 family)